MLKTDYKDDVYDGKRKYHKTDNDDGTISLDDVTEYTQEGDVFKADDMNATNKQVNDMLTVISITLTAAGWTGSAAPYSQTVSNESIKAAYDYDGVSLLADTADEGTAKAYNKAFGIISAGPPATTADGSVTFKVFKKPATDITIGLKIRGEAS